LSFRKNKNEIGYLKKAAKITVGIFAAVKKRISPGISERRIADEIESIIKNKGLKRSFRTIVASGPNAAKPHAVVTGRKIKKNDVVVIDFGVIYKGYHSDMTRTVLIGNADSKIKRLYKAVKSAQILAIKSVKPGLKISGLAGAAHGFIRKQGLGKYLKHSLGHGVGKRIHEPPKLSEKNPRELKKGMVITVEPGLYIKRKGGVRIEDMVCVTEKGHRVLT